ncbi:hypothetical protein WG922_16145 [Ramlibacter sp. AN1015]|uniref:hypothetical protein n=1 Tax=Ramlibacter sp. AN1015 TaxID=3133428 RepID=UPI0030C1AD51
MTTFVRPHFPVEHSGAARLARSVEFFGSAWRRTAHGSVVLAAVVAAVVALANQVVDTWTDGHLLAAWIVMWLVAFAALALFAAPVRRAAATASGLLANWRARRFQAAEDRRVWELALTDARVMADISRGMEARSLRDVRTVR